MYVDLPRHFRGTHMSRFLEILNKYRGEITLRRMGEILLEMKDVLEANCSHLEMSFPYFMEKEAPVSKSKSFMRYDAFFVASYKDEPDYILGVRVPVTTLCPCSKEISYAGAHNQRSFIEIRVRYQKDNFVWLEELIDIAESSASCEIYSLLKRPDEKYVTEKAYENPRFVEDVTRDVAQKLDEFEKVTWYYIEVENMESIHNHNAYAMIERHK